MTVDNTNNDTKKRRRRLEETWRKTSADRERLASYIEHRGLPRKVLDSVSIEVLRFHSALPYFDPEGKRRGDFPAMVAKMTDANGKGVTLHRTYLSPAGPGKLELGEDLPAKKLMTPVEDGATKGGSIKLSSAGSVLGVAEGVETALAAMATTGQHVWAAGSAPGLESVVLPPEVSQVHIWADRDASGRGKEAAEVLAARLADEGRAVYLHLPPGPQARDWLDVYAAEGEDPFLTALAEDPKWQEAPPPAKVEKGTTPRAMLRRFSEMIPEEVLWDWPGRLARGKLKLLAGDPGLGKTFVAIYIAALKSRGGTWPDGTLCEAGPVIIMSAEDGATDTLLPRLVNAGADLRVIHHFDSVIVKVGAETQERLFRLKEDIEVLEEAVANTKAQLVILDPLNGYLSGVDSHKAAEVRSALAPLAAAADRTKTTMLTVAHLNKRDGGTPTYRVGGSIDFVAAARVVHAIALESKESDRRLFLPLKNNLSRMPEGLGFQIVEPGVVQWDLDPVTVDVWQALGADAKGREPSKLQAAIDFLSGFLASGPKPAREVFGAAEEAGLGSDKLIYKAKATLGVIDWQEHAPGKRGAAPSWWSLPDAGKFQPNPLARAARTDQVGTSPPCAGDFQPNPSNPFFSAVESQNIRLEGGTEEDFQPDPGFQANPARNIRLELSGHVGDFQPNQPVEAGVEL